MKFTLKKIFLIAFILSLGGILVWMFFSKFKEGNFDCSDEKKEKDCNKHQACKWENNKCSLNKNFDCFKDNGHQRNETECKDHKYGCEWKKKSGHHTSACYLKGTV
jgi:hypothetical protein